MKWTLLLCGAGLLVAGCNSPPNPFGIYGEFSYNYDYVPAPVPDVSPAELTKIEQTPAAASVDASYRRWSELHNEDQ
jgi:hypothetical protein